MSLRLCTMFVALLGCAHAPPFPERTLVMQRRYLAERPLAIQGEQRHINAGVWCSDDDAFSLPVVPFPDGPVDVVEDYRASSVTELLSMFDVHDSVLQVIRTRIRPDWTELDATRRFERSAHFWDGHPDVKVEWVLQNGRKELQEYNPVPDYEGRESAASFWLMGGGTLYEYYKPESCRVDRRFVAHRYYFQVVAVAHRLAPEHDLCEVASELAAWASENIRVGAGCGPRAQ